MNNRIWFAQMLRAVAAISVFICHCMLGFWAKPELIPTLIQTPLVHFFSSKITYIYNFLESCNFNFGPFGVALFFLISGFVIPITLERSSLKEFAIRRFFRIFPTYATGLAITCIILISSAHFIGEQFNHTFTDYLVNATLIFQYILKVKTIDYLNWTLIIEVYFYIAIAIGATFLPFRNHKKFILFPVTIFAVALFLTFVKDKAFQYVIGYIIYMSIGTFIYLHYKYKSSYKELGFQIVITLCLFLSYLLINPAYREKLSSIYLTNYLLALVLFITFYLLKDKIKYNKFLDFIANISYPLYIIHGVGSYAIMSILYQFIPNYFICLAAAIIFSGTTAIILHKFVENPSMDYGKNLAKRLGQGFSPSGGGGNAI